MLVSLRGLLRFGPFCRRIVYRNLMYRFEGEQELFLAIEGLGSLNPDIRGSAELLEQVEEKYGSLYEAYRDICIRIADIRRKFVVCCQALNDRIIPFRIFCQRQEKLSKSYRDYKDLIYRCLFEHDLALEPRQYPDLWTFR